MITHLKSINTFSINPLRLYILLCIEIHRSFLVQWSFNSSTDMISALLVIVVWVQSFFFFFCKPCGRRGLPIFESSTSFGESQHKAVTRIRGTVLISLYISF